MNIRYNGIAYTDKGIAVLINTNVVRCPDAQKAIGQQINWIADNCTNVNDVAVENAMQYLWYHIIGIANDTLWQTIADYTAQKVKEGKIAEW